jgi:hypothetical protein
MGSRAENLHCNQASTKLNSTAAIGLQFRYWETVSGTVDAPNNAQNLQKDLKAVKTCATGSAGTAGAGAGLLAAGSNILSTGTKIGNFTPGTSVASQFFRAVLPQTIEATWAPTLLNPLATSSVLGGVVGRWVPVVGEALLIKSGVDFLNCVSANGDGFW